MALTRKFRCFIELENEVLTLTSPLTAVFTISRGVMSSLNSMTLDIYGLKRATRDKIFQDRFNPKNYKRIIFSIANDGVNFTDVFIGNIFTAYSERQGDVPVTKITARDGGFDIVNAQVNKTLTGGTFKEVVQEIIDGFPNVKTGKIGSLDGEFRRPIVLSGNSYDLIKKYTQDRVYIDLEQINILDDNEAIAGLVPLITSSSGLLKTPMRRDAYLSIETILKPDIILSQIIEIESSIAPQFDGQYKVMGITHSGTISEAVEARCQSQFDLLVGSQLFGGFNNV
jgi:hypothetical protein